MSNLEENLPGTLLICIPFYFVKARLQYLSESLKEAPVLAEQVQLVLVTDTTDTSELDLIKSAIPTGFTKVEIITPKYLGHPYFLTWSHFDIFRENLRGESPASYFMYREDDLQITKENIRYWIEHSEKLKGTPFTPAFLRFEYKADSSEKMLTDVTRRVYFRGLSSIKINSSDIYVSLENNYQGWYLLNQDDIKIHLNSISSNPDFGLWKIREKATQALNFIDVPFGFHSRNLLFLDTSCSGVDSRCLVRHLPNNYASDPNSPFGKIPLDTLLIREISLKHEMFFLKRKLYAHLRRLRRKIM